MTKDEVLPLAEAILAAHKQLPLVLLLLLACTPAQRDWRNSLYVDTSLAGTDDVEATTMNVGISYPLLGNLWGSMGGWTDIDGNIGPYWGMNYSFAPFAQTTVPQRVQQSSK